MIDFFTLLERKISGGSVPRTAYDVDFLYEKGIRTIISLTTHRLTGIDNRFKHVVVDIPDWGVPTVEQVKEIMKEIKLSWDRGEHVYVHCYAGCGRTGTILALVLILLNGEKDGFKAIQKVRKVRPCSLESTNQEEFVINFSQK
ncbi:MAG: phosphatase domain-containing protein [Candidatus Ranarchaeia archaeon]